MAVVSFVEAGTGVGEELGSTRGEAERIVDLAKDEESRVGGERGAAEFEPYPGVEVEQKRGWRKFTHEVLRESAVWRQ
jgi:hypothetical protein